MSGRSLAGGQRTGTISGKFLILAARMIAFQRLLDDSLNFVVMIAYQSEVYLQ